MTPDTCRTRAVVVGIERYRESGWNVDGPALDACRMVEWLTGHDVRPEQITALISYHEWNEETVRKTGLVPRPADRETVHRVFAEELPEQPADALFVYWVGHGMTYHDDHLLAFSDTRSDRRRYLNLGQLLRWLRTTALGYPRQTILVDACRTYAEDLNLITRPNCWDFDSARPAANRRQEALLAVPPGEPSVRPPGAGSTWFTSALSAELQVSTGPCQIDLPVLRDRIRAHPGPPAPVVLTYESSLGGPQEYLLGATDNASHTPAPRPGMNRSEQLTRLVSTLGAVQSMRQPPGRLALADELNLSYGHDLLRNAHVVNRADPSVPEIVRALSGMIDWPLVLRDVCQFRSDLFPDRQQAVADLFAFLELTHGGGGR